MTFPERSEVPVVLFAGERIAARGDLSTLMNDGLHVDQPLPIPNDEPDVQSQVIADIEARRQVGIERYGTALQPFNGRDSLRDAYEEALDLVMYLRQARGEVDRWRAVATGLAAALRGISYHALYSPDPAATPVRLAADDALAVFDLLAERDVTADP